MTAEAEGICLDRLSATNNLRLAAAAIGLAHTSLLARKRRSPPFAAAMARARAASPKRIARALRAAAQALDAELERRSDARPAWPPGMSVRQILHQLGAPPYKGPGDPFPAKAPPRSETSAQRSRAANGVAAGRPAGRPA